MAEPFSKEDLRQGWDALAKDWYSISKWKFVRDVNYTEWIAEWIAHEFQEIKLPANWLRAGTFQKTSEERRDDDLKKQVVRAIANAYHLNTLGNVIRSEFRFREYPASGFDEVDLLCYKEGTPLILEVIAPHSPESLLRAILKVFAHASHIAASPEDLLIKEDRGLGGLWPAPAVLTFADTESYCQIGNRENWPRLFELIGILNASLRPRKFFGMEFYVVRDDRIEDQFHIDGHRIFFKTGFEPNITQC